MYVQAVGKGVSATIGALRLHSIAVVLETALKERRAGETVDAGILLFDASLRELIHERETTLPPESAIHERPPV